MRVVLIKKIILLMKKTNAVLPDNKNIEVGTFDKDFHKITNYDWYT